MNGATALVYPSLAEGFGLPPLEAMAHGCPVLAGRNAGAVPEVLGEAAAYFDPADVESIRDALEQLLPDRERQARLAGLGRERVSRFSWDRMAQEIGTLYRLLAGSSASI
jgi:glycosyltransferase involved in cell wall biosynthesis